MPSMISKKSSGISSGYSVGLCLLASIGLAGLLGGCEKPAASTPAEQFATPPPDRPNVILIMTDDQALRALSTENNPHIRTPHLEKMAKEGAYFSRAYVPLPQCAPSRASMITGRYPHEHGVVSNIERIPDPGAARLPALMKTAGYRCAMIGKWHLGHLFQPEPGFDDGWVVYDGRNRPRETKYTNPTIFSNGKTVAYERFLGDVFTDYALDFIKAHRAEPFFLWLAFHEPHIPLTEHPDFKYDPASIPFPESMRDDLAGKPAAQRDGDPHKLFKQLEPGRLKSLLAQYYSMVSCADANVGRVVEALKTLGIEKRTLVLFISDNGWLLGEHQMYTKGATLYEELVRMPVIAWMPGSIPAGRRSESLVSSIDFFPTILGRAGIEPPPDLRGIDLWPLMSGAGTPPREREEIFLEYRGGEVDRPNFFAPMIGLVGKRWKYTRYLLNDEEELYDLAADPYEMRNLATDANVQATLMECREKVERFKATISKPYWTKPIASMPADLRGGD